MMNQYLVLLAAALAGVACVHACGDVVLSQSFDKYSGGYKTWTKDMGKEDLPGLIFLKFDDHVAAGDGNLRVENVEGCVGTALCGATFDVKLPAMDEATLSYKFKHSPGYVFGLGGKLPGLCAMDCPSGCVTVAENSGFSARVMWREDKENPSQTQLMSYSYYYGMDETNCGEDWHWNQQPTAGEWSQIEMYVKLNTDGQANGVQMINYNGAEVFHRSNIVWSTKPGEHPIEKFTFRSFHGGGSEDWASAQDQYIYFDDIKVTGGQCSGDSSSPTEPTTDSTSEPPESDTTAKATANAEVEVTTTDTSGDDSSGGDVDGGSNTKATANAEVEVTTSNTSGDDSSGGDDDGSSNMALFSSLHSVQKEATFVEEEDDEEPASKQDEPADSEDTETTTTSTSGGGNGVPSTGENCVPVPGYFCSDSNRLRKEKDRSREPENRSRAPKDRKRTLLSSAY